MRTRDQVLDWLTRSTFDPAKGCQHSHLTIALAIERSERQVIRAIGELEASGELLVERASRGSRRCNTYRVRVWNPNLRSEVVARCAEIRPERDRIFRARNAECQSKRTAKRSGSSNPGCVPQRPRAQAPVFAVNVKNSSARARKSAVVVHEGGRVSKDQPAPSDCCGLCGISPSEHAGLIALTRRLAGQVERWKSKADGREHGADIRKVLEVAHYWRDTLDKPKDIKLSPTGPRCQAIKRAFGWGYTVEQLQRCVDGAKLAPFEVYGQRRGAGGERKDDLTQILKDEKTVDALIATAAVGGAEHQPSPRNEPRFVRPPARRMTIDEFAAGIEGAKAGPDGQWTGRCPAHDDRRASLSFRLGDKGIVAHCNVGCSIDQIAGALGVDVPQLFDPEVKVPAAPAVKPAEPLPTLAQVARWVAMAQQNPALADRLAEVKLWSMPTLERLHVGWDGQRLTFPVHGQDGDLVNVIRYLPKGQPKTLGLRHRSRGLFPAPETIDGRVWLVEGEPDAVSGHELGLPAVAVPGTNGWRPEWAARLAGRSVVICFDCDEPGRKAALKVGKSLAEYARTVRLVDLDVKRTDGFDVTDALLAGWTLDEFVELAKAAPVAARFGGERAA